jgi:hypothetical protein
MPLLKDSTRKEDDRQVLTEISRYYSTSALTIEYQYKGYTVDHCGETLLIGVNADFNDPGYIETLKLFQLHLEVIRAAYYTYCLMPFILSPMKLDDEELDHWIEVLESFLRQTDVVFSGELTNPLAAIKQEKQRRENAAILRNQKQQRRQETGKGYVYLLRTDIGYYKIGRTKNIKGRMRAFGIQLPFNVECEHVIPSEDMMSLEKSLHERFASQRVNGEWFNLSADDVVYIKSIGGEA